MTQNRLFSHVALEDRLADGALIAGLFTPLAFQIPRLEAYENEKIGLLTLLASLIVGLWIGRIGRPARIPWRTWSGLPVVAGVALLALIVVVSTTFSLSPMQSVWGSSTRGQGLITLLAYLVLFVQAVRSGRRLQEALLPTLIMIAVPLCAWDQLFGHGLAIPGAGSTTGNPNYLSSWLVMALFVIAQQGIARLRTWPESAIWARRGYATLLVSVMGLMLLTLIRASSRGAMLGLVMALAVMVIAWVALARNTRALKMIFLIGLMIGGALYTIGLRQRHHPVNDIRLDVWPEAVTLIRSSHDPLVDRNGQPDRFDSLRPILGYGLDTVELTQNIGQSISNAVFLDRFHNQIFDDLVMLGAAGLIARLVIFGGAIYLALRALGLATARDGLRWLLFELFTALAGGALVGPLFPTVPRAAVFPAGAALGAVGGLLLWIGSDPFRRAHGDPLPTSRQPGLVMALLGVIVAHWVDGQFGFAHAAAEPLWWVLLGLLVVITRPERQTDPAPNPPVVSASEYWQVATLTAGALVLYAFGASLESRFLSYYAGVDQLPQLLLIVFLVGMSGAALTAPRPAALNTRLWVTLLSAWVVMWNTRRILNDLASRLLDETMSEAAITPGAIRLPFALLALNGVVLIVLILTGWVLLDARIARVSSIRNALLVFLCGLLGGAYYVTDYTASALHSAANTFSVTLDSSRARAADAAYDAAESLSPPDTRLYMDQVYLIMRRAEATDPYSQIVAQRIAEPLQKLFRYNPFFVNTREWEFFSENYVNLTGSSPP